MIGPTKPSRWSTIRLPSAGWQATLLVAALVALLRLPWIDRIGLHGDEDISTLAARGIAATGLPILPTGHEYWRAPLFHYLIAPLAATGVDWLPRLASVLFAVLTGALIVHLGSRWLNRRAAIVGGILFALSLPEIHLDRAARMYALYQLLALLSFGGLFELWRSGRIGTWITSVVRVALSMLAHVLGGTLAVLFLAPVLRHTSIRTRVLCILAVPAFMGASLLLSSFEAKSLLGGLLPVVEPPGMGPNDESLHLLRRVLKDDPLALGREVLGVAPFWILITILFIVGIAIALWGSRGRPSFSRLFAAAGLGLLLAAAAAHQIGLAFCLFMLLILVCPELFPPGRSQRAILVAGGLVAALAVVWIVMGTGRGYGPLDVVQGLTRWPCRVWRLFLWPPVVAIAAAAGSIAILLRSWKGRAGPMERILLFSIILISTLRGMLTGRTEFRYLVEIWPLWELVAGWTIVGAITWIARRTAAWRWGRAAAPAAATLVAAAVLLVPDTGLQRTVTSLKRGHDVSVRVGMATHTAIPDFRALSGWLRPRIIAGDRIVASDWLSSYAYIGQVDGWLRSRDYGRQSNLIDGVARDVYIGAEVLPDREAFLRFVRTGRTWVVVTGEQQIDTYIRLPSDVLDWLSRRSPAFETPGGQLKVYLIDQANPEPDAGSGQSAT